jgi:hypothetical protein
LSHHDRSRYHPAGQDPLPWYGRGAKGTLLVDGFVRAAWRIDRDEAGGATLQVDHAGRLSTREAADVTSEGERFLGFVAAGADRHDVRFTPIA